MESFWGSSDLAIKGVSGCGSGGRFLCFCIFAAGFPIFLFAYLMTKAYMGRERKTEEILLMFVVRNLVLRRSGVERV